jgi:hypothetical protein
MLNFGTKLGPYEILSPLGAGGMGEVYKARDMRLDRAVAIKVLHSHLSADPELKLRFEREAKAISQLSHPHICALYDVGNQDGVEYLVMELLEGQMLSDRLEKGALPGDQVLRIGVQIAEALDKAHKHGIVHRDLKPGNIMLTKTGVKLLDFGLAKLSAPPAVSPELTSLPTERARDQPLTEKGTILGTFQYMAPEQIEGAEADARTDIFSLGSVLYEMATGRKAFTGKSRASLLGSILKDDPPSISSIQKMTPPALDRVVKTCLAKDPDDRWQSARDVKSELLWIAEGGSQAGVPAPIAARRRGRERIAWMLAAAAGAGLLAVGLAYSRIVTRPVQIVRASILSPPKMHFSFAGDNAGPLVLSPDGTKVAFVAVGEGRPVVYVRPLDGLSATPLPGTEDATFPFWSPDSRSLGFFAQGKLKRIDIASGGSAATICNAPNARGGTWNRAGAILLAADTRQPIMRVAASGGVPVTVTKVDPAMHTTHRWPEFLPDGKHFLYFAGMHPDPHSEKAGIYFASLDGKENRRLVHTLAGARYSSGFLLFMRENSLLAQRFDPSSGRFSGEAVSVADGVQFDLSTWHGVFSVSDGNVLAFQPGGVGSATRLIWYDRAGKVLGTLGEKDNYVGPVRLSPDGRRVAAAIGDPVGDMFVFDAASGVKTRLTFSPSGNSVGAWSPDASQVLFMSNRQRSGRDSLYTKSSGGGGAEKSLLPEAEVGHHANDWSRDGRFVAYTELSPGRSSRIWILPLTGSREPFAVLPEQDGDESDAAFSPDSRWVAYQVFSSGAPTVFVAPLTGGGSKWQVSLAGGYIPRWRADGKELFYLAPDLTLMAAEVDGSGTEFHVGAVKPVFHTQAVSNPAYSYDVSSDGQRFLVNSLEGEGTAPITLVVNWRP